MPPRPTKLSIAKEFRLKYGAEMPTAKLARIMYEECPECFTNIEHARTTLRMIEGKLGEKKRIQVKDKSLYIKEDRTFSPYALPKSDEESFELYQIKGHKKGFIINDVHLPYHSVSALTAAIDFAKKENPDFIFINGDLVDFHSVSYFQKDPRKKRFSEELDILQEFIGELQKIFKGVKIYYKFGNHEERYDSFLYQKAHELKGVEEFELEQIVKKRCPNITIIRDKRIVVMNGLPFIHGHEYGRGVFNPVNAARGLFLQAKHSAVKGDCHTSSEHTEPNIFGKIMTTYSVGCLCGLTPKWLPMNKWNHGFAMIDVSEKGKFKFRNYRIYNGEVM
jgi:predicted phosphodiesterase